MREFIYKERTRRNLPHLQALRGTYFVTFRLNGTIPKPVLKLYHDQKEWLAAESKRIIRLRLENDSVELRRHENQLIDFQRQVHQV